MADGDSPTALLVDNVEVDDDKSESNASVETVIENQLEPSEEEISEKASELKEHDVLQEEIQEAEKVELEIHDELKDNDGWLKILGNDSILKKVIKEGSAIRPYRGDICTIRLKGCLQSDESVVFDCHDELTFQLGDAEVVSGLDLSIPLMCKGEVAQVKIASRFGYGALGLKPNVPGNADLLYDVELIECQTAEDLETLSIKDRREIGIQKRERGNFWYSRDEPSLAIQLYRRALEFLDEIEGGINYPVGDDEEKATVSEEMKHLMEERLKTYNNMAAAQLKIQAYDTALASVEFVLKCQPENSKAWFRKGKILSAKGQIDEALNAFRRVSELEPGMKVIHQEISGLQAKRRKERDGEKQLYQRMFNKGNDEATNTNTGSDSGNRSYPLGLLVGGAVIALTGAIAYRYKYF